MSLKVGIVGLPNVGKSTLFNALVSRRLSPTAAHPFTTIKPYEAVVEVPDEKLDQLVQLVGPEKAVPAAVTFVDIAGLVKGANLGQGLGNQFLSHIREVDAIIHVVRDFDSSASSGQVIPHVMGDINPTRDIEVVNLELEFGGITGKPVIYVFNVSEVDYGQKYLDRDKNVLSNGLVICAKLEEELMDLSEHERIQYLNDLGIKQHGLERLIKEAYKLLGLITFYTIKGGKEIHAWSLKKGSTALSAAERVHTDFAKNFIKAEVIKVDELLVLGSWGKAKETGKIRTEGKDYVIQDGDVIEFLVGS